MPSASPARTPQPRRGRSSANVTPTSASSTRSGAQRTPSTGGARRGRSASRGNSGMNTPLREEEPEQQQDSSQRSSSDIVPPSDSEERLYSGPAAGDGLLFDLSSPLNYGSAANSPSTATPHRQRADLRLERSLVRQINIASPATSTVDPGTPSSRRGRRGGSATPARPDSVASEDDGVHLVIWGTNVVVNRTKKRFREFINNYRESSIEEDEVPDQSHPGEDNTRFDPDQPLYMQKIDDIAITEKPFLLVNCAHLKKFDRELYDEIVSYPSEVIPVLDMAANEVYREKHATTILPHQIFVKPYNADKTQTMRELSPEDIDRLITICGMVIRCSNPLPEMREALFMCAVCSKTEIAELDRGRLEEPTLCSNCNTKHGFELIHNRCHFTDRQIIKLQEAPEDMPAGQTPHTVQLHVCNELVDQVQPGDRVTVTGIYRAVPFRVNPVRTSVKSVFRTHIDVLHFRKVDTKRLRDDMSGGVYFTEERVAFLKELSKKPDIYERLARAIAPSIYEHEDIKKGILLQLFGGSKKEFTEDCGRGHFRAEINILLCGDPGTSKSQLLQYVFNLIPRSQYTSGKGSSAVGLTAYVLRDVETKQLVLQTGALVLADNGVCCIDEFDKMSDATRSVLHEVMEQQTLSIAKAGLICQLNARTSILAAANPIDSQWNKSKTIVENIQLPHTLMSRFDLIFLMLDPQDELYDRRLAKHLVALYYKRDKKTRTTGDGMEVDDDDDDEEDESQLIDMAVLRDYIAYGREYFNPILNEEAAGTLINAYVEMRRAGSGRGQITAYPRQLESLMRLAEAHAKMRFSDVVEKSDVDEAWRLYREALKQSATDPSSGKIDVSILTTGMSSAARKRRIEVAQALKSLVAKKGKEVTTINLQRLFMEFRDSSDLAITKEMFDDALRDLQDDTFLVVAGRTVRVNQGINALD